MTECIEELPGKPWLDIIDVMAEKRTKRDERIQPGTLYEHEVVLLQDFFPAVNAGHQWSFIKGIYIQCLCSATNQ